MTMRIRRNRPHTAAALSVAAILLFSLQATWAGGGQAYTNGSEDFGVGKLPDPGLYYIHYMNYYNSDHFKGNDRNGIDAAPETTTFANTSRLLWVTNAKILGGTYATHFFLPYLYTEKDFDDGSDFGRVPSLSSDDKFGIGNIIFSPFIVGWHRERLHYWINLVDIFAPTRMDYDKRDAVNLGNNTWTFQPVFAFSYFPGKFEITSKFMYDFTTKDYDHIVTPDEARRIGRLDLVGQEAEREPGQEFHFDYTLAYHPNERLEIGAVGYFYQQVTNDRINDTAVRERRGRVLGIGPGIKYNLDRGSLIGKVYFETLAKNRYQGINAFFKFTYKF